jgi:hypothetical protein
MTFTTAASAATMPASGTEPEARNAATTATAVPSINSKRDPGLRPDGVGEPLSAGGSIAVPLMSVFAAPAEFVRTIIVANINEGLAAARARGQRLGRPRP